VNLGLRLIDPTRSEARAAYRSAGLDLTATIGAGDDYAGDDYAGDDYAAPQRLARLVHDDDYDGMLYTARHDPGHTHRSIALFGPAGPNDTDAVFDFCETRPLATASSKLDERRSGSSCFAAPPCETAISATLA